jgi:hypothetical protein
MVLILFREMSNNTNMISQGIDYTNLIRNSKIKIIEVPYVNANSLLVEIESAIKR